MIHVPRGIARAAAATRVTISSHVRAVVRSSWRLASPSPSRCPCPSMNPGITSRPRASITCVARRHEPPHLGVRADGEDPVARHRHRFGLGLRRVDGDDATVHDGERGAPRPCAVAGGLRGDRARCERHDEGDERAGAEDPRDGWKRRVLGCAVPGEGQSHGQTNTREARLDSVVRSAMTSSSCHHAVPWLARVGRRAESGLTVGSRAARRTAPLPTLERPMRQSAFLRLVTAGALASVTACGERDTPRSVADRTQAAGRPIGSQRARSRSGPACGSRVHWRTSIMASVAGPYVWSTKDPSIALVNPGAGLGSWVRGLTPGTTELYVSGGGVRATIPITVLDICRQPLPSSSRISTSSSSTMAAAAGDTRRRSYCATPSAGSKPP